jgi:hypothetical protein
MSDLDVSLAEALDYTRDVTPASFAAFAQALPASWIEEALATTGTGSFRTRRLPAEVCVWLVLGMSLIRNLSITALVDRLGLALPAPDGSRTVAPSAVAQARARLGADPLEVIFTRSGTSWAHASAAQDRWQGLALFAVDGTTLRVADSSENRAHFGSQDAGETRGVSGYPLMRLVTLMAVRSHLLAAAAFGPYGVDERTYAQTLWADVPDNALVLVDRAYLQADVLVPMMTTGIARHWLTRTKTSTRYRQIRRLGPGDDLVEFAVSSEARRKDASLPTHFDARVICYQRKGYPPGYLVTSMVDPKAFPAAEIRALYHERWEIELGFGELKTDMLERLETLRSKSPTAVAQECWGLLTVYNLVRLEMERLATELGVPPLRVSFVAALRECAILWLTNAATTTPGNLPKEVANMRDHMRRFLLPPRRPERVFPRAVKIKMSNYPRKRPAASPRKRPAASPRKRPAASPPTTKVANTTASQFVADFRISFDRLRDSSSEGRHSAR